MPKMPSHYIWRFEKWAGYPWVTRGLPIGIHAFRLGWELGRLKAAWRKKNQL